MNAILLFIWVMIGKSTIVSFPINDEPLKFPEYADSVFLEIKGNLNDHPEYIWQHQDIWIRAGERLEQHLFVENGRFVWDVERGSDIKISENIFEWFVSGWEDQNKKLATGHFEIDTIDGRKWALPKPGYNLLGEKIEPGEREIVRIVIDSVDGGMQAVFQKERVVSGDGTNFRNLAYADALAVAKAEGKLLFVDCYTAWCGPCRQMAEKVFPQKEAGDYFNPRFVCVKYDMEKGEGGELAKQWEVRAFPTFLIIRPDGTIQHRLVGADDLEAFIARVEQGLNAETSLEAQKRRYAEGGMDNRQLMAYWQTLNDAADPDEAKVYTELLGRLSDTEKLQPEYWGIYYGEACVIGSPLWQFMLAHLPELREQVGSDKVDRLLTEVYWDALSGYVMGYNQEGDVPFDTLARDVPALGVKAQADLDNMLRLADLVCHQKTKELARLLEDYLNEGNAAAVQSCAFGYRGMSWGTDGKVPKDYAKQGERMAESIVARMEQDAAVLTAEDLNAYILALSCFEASGKSELQERIAAVGEQVLSRLPENEQTRSLRFMMQDFQPRNR